MEVSKHDTLLTCPSFLVPQPTELFCLFFDVVGGLPWNCAGSLMSLFTFHFTSPSFPCNLPEWRNTMQRTRDASNCTGHGAFWSYSRGFFFPKRSLLLQFVCATHWRVVLDQTMMLHQTVQRSRLVGPWPKKRSGFALWPAAARTTLEPEAQKAATLCMCVRTSL